MVDWINQQVVRTMFETLPAKVTVIDANDEVIGWNSYETGILKRPMTLMGMNFLTWP